MGSGTPPLQARASMGLLAGGLTAAGTTQGTALQLPSDFNVFTTVAASSGTILPATGINAQVADVFIITNHGANTLAVYPPVGGTISTLAANTALSVPAGKQAYFSVVGTNAYSASVSA